MPRPSPYTVTHPVSVSRTGRYVERHRPTHCRQVQLCHRTPVRPSRAICVSRPIPQSTQHFLCLLNILQHSSPRSVPLSTKPRDLSIIYTDAFCRRARRSGVSRTQGIRIVSHPIGRTTTDGQRCCSAHRHKGPAWSRAHYPLTYSNK